MLQRGDISASQMKQALDGLEPHDIITPFIKDIRTGDAVAIEPEQVRHYNSLQAFQAHRFVVDPDGKFEVAAEVMADRKGSSERSEPAR